MIYKSSSHDGILSALDSTADADRTLRHYLQKLIPNQERLAILAVGGYGRCDNSPQSDLDLIILFDQMSGQTESALKQFIQLLWDHKLTPAQTAVKMEDINGEYLSIPDRASALLEARLLWGDRSIARELDEKVNKEFTSEVMQLFITRKRQEQQQRHQKYGSDVRVVEPHLKSQAGGLRDLHHVFWIYQATVAYTSQWKLRRKRVNQIVSFFLQLKNEAILTEEDLEELLSAYNFLLRIRESLQSISGRSEDVLAVGFQPDVGRMLGFSGKERIVMRKCCRTLYLNMDKLARFSEEFSDIFSIPLDMNPISEKNIQGFRGVRERSGRLQIDHDLMDYYARSPERLLALVDYSVERECSFTGDSRHLLRKAIGSYWRGMKNVHAWGEPLRKWLTLESGFERRLRILSELNAIAVWLPEWDEINGLSTGSFYHNYAVDEHTLRGLAELEEIRDGNAGKHPEKIWSQARHRDWVYMAILFHDIAKGRRGDHSLAGAQLAREALHRLQWDDLSGPISTLVRLHLRLEQVAFRRDTSDPLVIAAIGREIPSKEMLDALYLLTICDLRSVRDGIWSTWKGKLLSELYETLKNWFISGGMIPEITVDEEVNRVARRLKEVKSTPEEARKFIETMQEEYRRVIPAEEIVLHLEMMQKLLDGEPWVWHIIPEEGYIILTIVTSDRIGLLADVAGLLVSQGIGIREARIFTRDDGVVIDRFRAVDIDPEGVPIEERLDKIIPLWRSLMEGEVTLMKLLEGYHRKFRKVQQRTAVTETEVSISPSGNRYLLDLSGPDRVGLLYRLCQMLAKLGLNVKAARVSARIDGIQDALLLEDSGSLLSTSRGRMKVLDLLRGAMNEKM